jgi:hypothetical protein
MITFKQFLSEDENVNPFDLIKRDCQPFLSQSGGKFLTRGFRSWSHKPMHVKHPFKDMSEYSSYDSYPYVKKAVRKDRTPVDMSKEETQILDDYFQQKFKVRPRTQAAFCYPERLAGEASEYGALYAIFPIGNFKVIWSPMVKDLYHDFDNLMAGLHVRRAVSYKGDKSMYQDALNRVEAELDELNFKMDLEGALNSNSEIMLLCDEYYGVPYESYGGKRVIRMGLDD